MGPVLLSHRPSRGASGRFFVDDDAVGGDAKLSSAGGPVMGRGKAAAIVGTIFFTTMALVGVIVWQATAHGIPLNSVLGGLMIFLGAGFTALHLSVTDEYLVKNFGGEENAHRMREMWSGGWVGIVAGLGMIAAGYFLG
jgi:hypothetical protein